MSRKGGKKGSKQESLYQVLHAQNPKITREMVKQAGGMTGMTEMLKLYAAPGASENYNTAAIGRLKTDEQIQTEQSDAFATTRQQAANAASSAKGLASGFTGALGAATGNLAAFGGTNAAALQGLVNAGEASTGDTLGATNGLTAMSTAGNLLASIAQTQGVSSAKAQRDLAGEGYRKDRAALKDTRRTQGIDLRSKNQAAIVSMVGSLLGLAPAGGSGGGGSGSSGGGGSDGKFGDSFDPWKGYDKSIADFYGGQKTGYGKGETYGSDSKPENDTPSTPNTPTGMTNTSASAGPPSSNPIAATGYKNSYGPGTPYATLQDYNNRSSNPRNKWSQYSKNMRN